MPSLSLSMSILLFIPSLSVSIGQSLTGISSDGDSVPQLIMNFNLIISRSFSERLGVYVFDIAPGIS
jgi:hypothetical protein